MPMNSHNQMSHQKRSNCRHQKKIKSRFGLNNQVNSEETLHNVKSEGNQLGRRGREGGGKEVRYGRRGGGKRGQTINTKTYVSIKLHLPKASNIIKRLSL